MLFVVIVTVVELSGTGISTLFSLVLKHIEGGRSLQRQRGLSRYFS